MKATRRIIFTILVLAAIITAFTVVALAEETETLAPKKFTTIYRYSDLTFDSYETGSEIASLKTGTLDIVESDTGENKYILNWYNENDTTVGTSSYWDIHATTARSTYSLVKYPMVSFDFDVMTQNGTYGKASSGNAYINPRYYKSSTSGSTIGSVYFASMGLDTTPYKWQHVSLVYDFDGTSTFTLYCYVNGVQTYTKSYDVSSHTKWTGYNEDYSSVHLGNFLMYAPTSYSSEIALDNFAFTYFPEQYTHKDASTYIFNESYTLPFGRTEAKIGNTVYDDVTEAIAAAGESDTVILTRDADETLLINKSIIIDTNVYKADEETGEAIATGSYYTFDYESTQGYDYTLENGIYTFEKSADIATVIWDPICEGDCDCYSEFGGHLMNSTSITLLGEVPEYTGSVPTFAVVDGCVKSFAGWSYDNDGSADTLTEIDEDDVKEGTVYIYPVYTAVQHSFEVISSAGVSSYYLESEYTTAMAAVAAGGTIKLHTDVTVESGYTFTTANASVVIDLNGHDFNRYSIYSVHYNATWDETGGVWVKGDKMTKTTTDSAGNTKTSTVTSGSAPSAFTVSATGLNITIRNTGEAANIYTFTLCRDALYDSDGNCVGYDSVRYTTSTGGTQNGGAILFGYTGAKSTTINIEGEGISYYGACLVLNEWGGNQNTSTVNIDGGSYYVMVDTYLSLISQLAGGRVNVSNATLVTNGNSLIRVSDAIGNSSQFPITTVDFTFTNCDIIGGSTYNPNTAVGAAGIKINDCRYYATAKENQGLTLGRGTYVNLIGSEALIADGNTSVSHTFTKTLDLISETAFIIDEESCTVSYDFTPVTNTYTFIYKIADIDEDCALINWIDPEGYLIDSTYALKNATLELPSLKVPCGDGYRGVTNVTAWLDADGDLSDLYIGEEEEYDLFALLPDEADREYTACMTSAMFNMVYFTNFAYNVYVPRVDGVEITDLGGRVPTNTVWISNTEYWVYTTYAPSTQGLDDTEVNLSYVIDGASYSAKFKPSAIFYANVIANDPYAEEDEKELVGCLIRYIEESYLAANGGEISDANQAKLDSFYSVYTPAPYAEEYPDAALFDSGPFVGLLSTVNLSIESGKVRFIFTLTDEAVAAGYKIKAKGLTGALYTTDGKVFTSDNTPLRTHVMETFTITIVDKDGATVTVENSSGETVEVSSYYSLAAYVNATGNSLAKSLYAFGTALRAYYPVSKDNYQVSEITLFGDDLKNYTIAADIDDPTEYYVAEQLQALLYNRAGYWLEIVPSTEASKSLVITLRAKTGDEGFRVTFEDGRIEVVCEYEALISANTVAFFKEKLATIGAVNFTDSDNYIKNIRDVYYSDFGAVGDGVTDDSEAIRAAHEYANEIGHTVCADPNATYYIGPMTSHITIKTDVNWSTAKFIIDDTGIAPTDAARSVKIFNVSAGESAITYTASSSEAIAAINAAGGIDADTITKLDLGLGYAATLQVYNSNHRNYVRYGVNANTGAAQQEVILVDAEGNIDPSTPFMFDYEEVTSIAVRRIDATPITIDGGIFTTKANAAPCAYTQYLRNIQVVRPNTTVKNLTHYITDEGETGAPYAGFISVHTAYNVTFENCKLSGHKTYYNASGTGMGTYDISASSSIDVTWKNCTQTNFFSNEETEATTKSTHWGIMGSSYCKNLSFDSCRLTRFDAHAGVYNVSIKDCEMIHITIVGAGSVNVENTTIYNNAGIQLRTDYGSFWHGDVTLKDISFRNSGTVNLITCTWYNHDFGYPTALPDNITVDGLTLKSAATVNIFSSSFVTSTNEIIKDSFEEAVLDEEGNETGESVTVPNVNKMTPPKTITVKNNTEGYTIVLPDKEAYPFFADCEYNVISEE